MVERARDCRRSSVPDQNGRPLPIAEASMSAATRRNARLVPCAVTSSWSRSSVFPRCTRISRSSGWSSSEGVSRRARNASRNTSSSRVGPNACVISCSPAPARRAFFRGTSPRAAATPIADSRRRSAIRASWIWSTPGYFRAVLQIAFAFARSATSCAASSVPISPEVSITVLISEVSASE